MKTKPTNKLLISIALICITSTYEIVTPLSFINLSISIESQASTEIEKKILTERASCINYFSSGNELNAGVFSSIFS